MFSCKEPKLSPSNKQIFVTLDKKDLDKIFSMGRITEIVKHLLIINIIFFFASSVLGEIMYDLFAMHYPNNPNFFIWQPITHMFMHGDLTHIMFNMFGL